MARRFLVVVSVGMLLLGVRVGSRPVALRARRAAEHRPGYTGVRRLGYAGARRARRVRPGDEHARPDLRRRPGRRGHVVLVRPGARTAVPEQPGLPPLHAWAG